MLTKKPFEPLVDISFDLLTYKTVFLVALASGARVSEIHGLTLEGFTRNRNWSKVWLSPGLDFMAKNQRSRAPSERRCFEIPALADFSGDSKDRFLCPVRALRLYLAKSQHVRKNKKLLFLSVNKGYSQDISKNTIAQYIKKTILLAYQQSSDKDIALSNCTVHEVRKLSASVAYRYNVSLSDIMDACCWKSHNVFTNFYLRDLALQTDSLYKLPAFVCAQKKLRNK